MAVFFFTAQVAWAGNIKTEKVTLVGNGIVEFIPVGYDAVSYTHLRAHET